MRPASGLAVRRALTVYRLLLWLYPPRFRRAFQEQLLHDFAALYQTYHQDQRWWQGIAFWSLIMHDLLTSLRQEYRPSRSWLHGWSWLHIIGVIGVSGGVYRILEVIGGLFFGARLYPSTFTLEWWLIHVPMCIWSSCWIWALPFQGRMQAAMRVAGGMLFVSEIGRTILWFIPNRHQFDFARTNPPLGRMASRIGDG